jgi:hypothetical protein
MFLHFPATYLSAWRLVLHRRRLLIAYTDYRAKLALRLILRSWRLATLERQLRRRQLFRRWQQLTRMMILARYAKMK